MSAETDLILATKFYDSAYPGSMCNRATGDFVHRTDAASLAGALLAMLHARSREVEDVLQSLENIAAERDKLQAAHVPNFEELMELRGISVWQDPDWNGGRYGTPRWLAGVGLRAEEGTHYSTLTGSGPASLEGEHIASGDTPAKAVCACADKIAKAAGGAS